MPKTGEVSRKGAIYFTMCCRCEMRIQQGVPFPECSKCKKFAAWLPVGGAHRKQPRSVPAK
jgi:hypothetical protein